MAAGSGRSIVGALLLPVLLAGCAAAPRPLQFVSGPDPVYPPAARSAGIEGRVTLRYDVGADGTVSNLRVVEAEPEGVFDRAALEAVARWRFRPPAVEGRTVPLRGRVSTLEFRLGGSDAYAEY